MPYVDDAELQRMQRAHQILASRGYDIIAALRGFAEYMTKASKEHQAAHAAGAETPLVTNEGYRVMAELFATNAERAESLATAIDIWSTVDPESEEKPAPVTLPGRLRPDLARPAWPGPLAADASGKAGD
ncbi:hypothetical protein [Streptosporangium lutulentum]|uniref:Uncharacterized protein n=1 Tax=Streptosporangium lutulentum TaxID=1461250 RepID=A0ABT9QBB5_9ACTN|nr:hypothetical protein [Streptosporangium lutulentum]MDP9843334.1 hypothetical protein [Streptosporangium lutulentum]